MIIEEISLPDLDSKAQSLLSSFFATLERLRALDHPNFIRLLDVFEHKEKLFIVYEDFAGGSDLYDKICETGGFSEKHSCRLLQDLLSMFSYLQNQGLSLRKISAEAFHVRFSKGEYQMKLMDLTLITPIAKLMENIKENERNRGYSRDFYSPPEEPDALSIETLKRESFSVGVLFFLLLKGSFPFNQEDLEDINEKEDLGDTYKINFEDLELPVDITYMLRGLLENDPEKRISIAEARKSEFCRKIPRKKREKVGDLGKFMKAAGIRNPVVGVFRVLLVRFFGDNSEKDELWEDFNQFDHDYDGFIEGSLFGLGEIKPLLGMEDFLMLCLQRYCIEEKIAKEKIFDEIAKGGTEITADGLWEFLGKDLVEKGVLEEGLALIGKKLTFEEFMNLEI